MLLQCFFKYILKNHFKAIHIIFRSSTNHCAAHASRDKPVDDANSKYRRPLTVRSSRKKSPGRCWSCSSKSRLVGWWGLRFCLTLLAVCLRYQRFPTPAGQRCSPTSASRAVSGMWPAGLNNSLRACCLTWAQVVATCNIQQWQPMLCAKRIDSLTTLSEEPLTTIHHFVKLRLLYVLYMSWPRSKSCPV